MISPKAVLYAPKGGVLEVISPEGEIVQQFAVPEGRSRASTLLDLVPAGHEVRPGKGVTVFPPASGVSVKRRGQFATAANPHFKPVNSGLEGHVRALTRALQSRDERLDRLAKAVASIPRIPRAPVEAQPQTADKTDEGESVVE